MTLFYKLIFKKNKKAYSLKDYNFSMVFPFTTSLISQTTNLWQVAISMAKINEKKISSHTVFCQDTYILETFKVRVPQNAQMCVLNTKFLCQNALIFGYCAHIV